MMRQTDSQGSSVDEQNEIDSQQYEGGTSADGVQTSVLGTSGQQEADMESNASHGQSSTADGKQLSPIAPFVSKTYGIVNDESDDVVSWWTSGGEDTFVIKSVDVFQEQVLPRFFSHRNYSSFVRQLNNHGFSRVRSPSSAGDGRGGRPEHEAQWWEFKHPRFRRGQKNLLSEIKRRKEKKRPPLGAHSRVFPHHSALAQSGHHVGGEQGEHVVRWEMENMQEQMRDVSRKLDELKSLVVGLVVCVRESGISSSVQQSSIRRSATEGAWGARSEGFYGYAPGVGQTPQSYHHHSGEQPSQQQPSQQQQSQQQPPQQQPSQQQQPQQQPPQQQQPQQQQPQQQPPQQQQSQQQKQQQQPSQQQQPQQQIPHHQLQQQQQYHVSTYPPPSLPPNLAPHHQHPQPLEQGQQQINQQSEPQKHSQQHPSTGWGANTRWSDCGTSSTAGGDSCLSMQQVSSGKAPLSKSSRIDKSAVQENVSQAEDDPRQSSPNAVRMKRPREDTTPYHNPHPHPQRIDAPPPPAPAFASAGGPRAPPGPRVEGPTEPLASAQAGGPGAVNMNAGPSCLGPPGNVYPDVHMRFAPDGVAGGGAGGGGQHMGGMAHWHKPWPGGTVDNIYQYHVPIRVTGYPIPMQSVPMQYTVPPTGPSPFVSMRGGGAPSGVPPFSSQSPLLPLPEQLPAQPQAHPRAAVPMQVAEGSIAMALSTMKGGPAQQAPIDGGKHHPHPHHQQQREYENRETLFVTGPSQSSGHPMTSAPSS